MKKQSRTVIHRGQSDSQPQRHLRDSTPRVREDLEGYIPPELRIVSAVHLAHAALADLGGDFIRAEAGARAEGHKEMAGL